MGDKPGRIDLDDQRFLLSESPVDRRQALPCTAATTLTGYSMTLATSVVVAVTCKRWGCQFCGPKKVHRLAHLTKAAVPTTLITLTVDAKLHESPRAAYDNTRRAIPHLVRTIRRSWGDFEYLKVLEVTKKGWPHYHFVARCSYIPQRELSHEWALLTGAPIVDIRKIKKTEDAYWYVVKYLAKQAYIPWTSRRVSMTKRFVPKLPEEPKPSLQLEQVERFNEHPFDWLAWRFPKHEFTQISPLVFAIGANTDAAAAQAAEAPEQPGDFS